MFPKFLMFEFSNWFPTRMFLLFKNRFNSFKLISDFRLVWATSFARPPSLRWRTWSSCSSRDSRPSPRRTFRFWKNSRWETPESRPRRRPDEKPKPEAVKPEITKAARRVTERSRRSRQRQEVPIRRSRRTCRSPCRRRTPSPPSTLSTFLFSFKNPNK